jgi:4-amino-4-deoxy-L-arabinose transferase-like glycosyltransferase
MAFFKKHSHLLVITLVGLGLRLYNLTAISLWHDEAFSALLIRYSWPEMMYRIGLDVHPPMYYIFLRVWHYVFGSSLWSLRGFSAFFGVGLIILTYVFVRDAFKSQSAAIIAALLVALSPFQISYVTEARMYTMGAFFAVLGAWGLVKALEAQRGFYDSRKLNMPHLPLSKQLKQKFVAYYLLSAISLIIITYTHYYLLFTAAAIGFYGLLYHWHAYKDNLRRYTWLIAYYLLIGVAFLPWLKTFLFQFRQVGGNYWIPPMDRWSIPDTVWRLFLGYYTGNHWLLAVMFVVVLIILVFVLRRVNNFSKWLTALCVVAPFAGAILFAALARLKGESSSVYLLRYFLFTSTFFLVMIALWLEHFRPQKAAYALLGIIVVINLFAYGNEWKNLDTKNHRGMAAAADLLAKNVEWNHKLYVGSSFEFFNLKYYLHQKTNFCESNCYTLAKEVRFPRPLLYSGGITEVEQLPHYAGTAILTSADLLPDFNLATKNGDTVWLLWTTGFGGSKPQVPNNWTQIDEKGYADVRPYLGTWVVVTEYKVN